MNNKPPVFLVGPVRSGSTFLRLMLHFHSQINNPGECDFLFDQVGEQGELPDSESYKQWLTTNRIFQSKELEINPSLNSRELLDSFIDQFSSEESVLTLNVHRHFHRISHVFPDARYIHLLRDPRDVARSCIGMGWVGHVYYGADIWREAELSWENLKVGLRPEQYLEIKYEDLLENVVAGLTRICHFLGVDYSERMLDYADNSTYALPDKSLSYQWKRKYSVREQQLVEGKLGKMITDRGYERRYPDAVLPGGIERFGLYLKNKKFRAHFQIRRYGLLVFLEGVVVNHIKVRAWLVSHLKRRTEIDNKYLK